jgi:glutamate racemase
LVALAEAKLAGDPIDQSAIDAAVQPLRDSSNLDTVVLACTHFPLLAEELAAALPGTQFVDGGPGIARRIVWLTRDQLWPATAPSGIAIFTGARPAARLIASLGKFGLAEVETL